MSTMPPNLAGSVLQSHLVQRQVSNVRTHDEAQKVTAERKQSVAIDEQDSTVETTDADTQVHTDAEGSGSQGRAFAGPEEQAEEQAPSDTPAEGDAGHHIDCEA